MLVREKVKNRLLKEPFERIKEFVINVLVAGVSVGKSHFKLNHMILEVFRKYPHCRKFVARTPLTISVLEESKKVRNELRKEIEVQLEKIYNKNIDLKVCTTIKEFISLDPNEYAILITNDAQFTNSKYSNPSKGVTYLIDYCKKVSDKYGYGAVFLCADEISHAGSTEEATTKGNLSNQKQIGYKGSWIGWCMEFAKEIGYVVGMTGTYLNEMSGNLQHSGVIPELLENPDIYNIVTDLEKLPIEEELTNFVSNLDQCIFSKKEDLIEVAFEKFEERKRLGNYLKMGLEDYFSDLSFNNVNQKLFVVTSFDTYDGKLKDQKESNIPHHQAVKRMLELYKSKGFSQSKMYFFETLGEGNYAFNCNAKFDDKGKLDKDKTGKNNYIEVDEDSIEDILSGKLKESDDKRLLDIEIVFALEKLKMAANIPSLNIIVMCRERKGQKLSDDIFILVQIIQAYGRVLREFFGIDFENMCAEEVVNELREKYSSHPEFMKLMRYIEHMHSHDVICPDTPIYHKFEEGIKKNIVATKDISVFASENQSELKQGIVEIWGNEYDILEGNINIKKLELNDKLLQKTDVLNNLELT